MPILHHYHRENDAWRSTGTSGVDRFSVICQYDIYKICAHTWTIGYAINELAIFTAASCTALGASLNVLSTVLKQEMSMREMDRRIELKTIPYLIMQRALGELVLLYQGAAQKKHENIVE